MSIRTEIIKTMRDRVQNQKNIEMNLIDGTVIYLDEDAWEPQSWEPLKIELRPIEPNAPTYTKIGKIHTVNFNQVKSIVDASACPKKILWERKDPLFDAIKSYLGYKMHDSEIWDIVNLAMTHHPRR